MTEKPVVGNKYKTKAGNVYEVKAVFVDYDNYTRVVLSGPYGNAMPMLHEVEAHWEKVVEKFEVGKRYKFLTGDWAAEYYDVIYITDDRIWVALPPDPDNNNKVDVRAWRVSETNRSGFEEIGTWK